METDEEPTDNRPLMGRPKGRRDSYQREQPSRRQLRADRLHELGEVLMEPGQPEVQNALCRIVVALLLSGWTVERYLSDPTTVDIIERLLAPMPTVSKPLSKRRRSLTGHPDL